MTKTNVFISFSFDSSNDKKKDLENILNQSNYAVNFSEKEDRSHLSDETIWQYLKKKISGSSVMVVIYSMDFERGRGGKAEKVKDNFSWNDNAFRKQGWIYKELRCALRHSENNAMNGIVVIMPDNIYDYKYSKSWCNNAREGRISLNINNYPEILKKNYGNKIKKYWKPECGCCFNILEDSYIPIVKYSEFKKDPKYYIEKVKAKRDEEEKYIIVKESD